ncbi:hypothetical protein GCM10009848_50860 [Micromonospora lupini]|uniref:SUKH-4 immunity protein n=1 Tax=Micromonospora lupini str. Lupac 08 TaxID=1150864 RepID=I0LDV3_9ACTN|nr:Protein of unknown function [Micromonospora lupini str. Lupac 08]
MSAPVEDVPGWESLSPELRERFRAADLPAALLKLDDSANFLLGPALTEQDVPPLGQLLRFGYGTGLFEGEFCLSLATGAVHLIRPDLPPNFVNSTLDQFGQSARLTLRYERDLTEGDVDTYTDAAEQIRAGIARIDPAADETDTYWDSLYYELAAGTYTNFE